MKKRALFVLLPALASLPLWAASYYPQRLDDPKAVYLTPDQFPVHADGVATTARRCRRRLIARRRRAKELYLCPRGVTA